MAAIMSVSLLIICLLSVVAVTPNAKKVTRKDANCLEVTKTPKSVRRKHHLPSRLVQYTHAFDIPIIASQSVSAEALTRACYAMLVMMADRYDIRARMKRKRVKIIVVGKYEKVRRQTPYCWYFRPRAVGPGHGDHSVVLPEENLICDGSDRYMNEDVETHMLAHAIDNLVIRRGFKDWHPHVKTAFEKAVHAGLWKNSYAHESAMEYLAEAVQSYFGMNDKIRKKEPQTRKNLKSYDELIYKILTQVFPCQNKMAARCIKLTQAHFDEIRKDCPEGFELEEETNSVRRKTTKKWTKSSITSTRMRTPMTPRTRTPIAKAHRTTASTSAENQGTAMVTEATKVDGSSKRTDRPQVTFPNKNQDCTDDNQYCEHWTKVKKCEEEYMRTACRKSCRKCKEPIVEESQAPCQDSIPFACKSWARKGYCGGNPTYMLQYCRKSCDFCSKSDCVDSHKKCQKWSQTGECTRNPKFMSYYCMHSCNACKRPKQVRLKSGECKDIFPAACQFWNRLCTAMSSYMLRYCPETCYTCIYD